MTSLVRKAVISVVGSGECLLPASRTIPSEMLPIHDKPLVQYAVEEAVTAGIEEVVIVASRRRSVIERHFFRSGDRRASGSVLDCLQ